MTLLLAKPKRDGRVLTLEQHLADTEQAATALFRAGTRWARSFLRFFKLDDSGHARFLLHLRVAALLHDLGKANAGFLAAMDAAPRFLAQPVRHEHLSAILLAHPEVSRWLAGNPELDQDVVLAAVLSHHLKAASEGDWEVLRPGNAAPMPVFFDHPQVTATLVRIANAIGVAPATLALPRRYDPDDPWWAEALDSFWEERVPRFDRAILSRSDPARLSLNLAVKAGLIAADSVASAMFRIDRELAMPAWIDDVAHAAPLVPGEIEREIIEPRRAEIAARGTYRREAFQDGAATIGRHGLLLAGCGAGKTMAAWRWADAVARAEPIGRVIFLYPTRGTATEGFRDYVGHAPEGRSTLVHATARYELDGMLGNPEDLPPSLRGKSFLPDEAEDRLFALGLWSKRYFSATVDQFLSFIEHGYRGLCLLPALADAAVIFDEVHSYDPSMWRALLSFLEHFDVPVLCMTATLLPERRADLAGFLHVYPDAVERDALADLVRAETRPRYHLKQTASEDTALDELVAHLAVVPDARVLWVVNTVGRCQQQAVRLAARLGREVLVYHSRFTLDHRQQRHRDVIGAFQRRPGAPAAGVIAVTTQVCEMSLDLDADVLVTELAPIPSLVQRFGRANRHADRGGPGDEFRALLLTYRADGDAPYQRADLEAAARFVAALAGPDVSQASLAEGMKAHGPPGVLARGTSTFVTGGFFATPNSFRESDEHGVRAVLASQLSIFLARDKARDLTDGLLITVPRQHATDAPSGSPRWLRIADDARYSDRLGFIVDDDLLSHATGAP